LERAREQAACVMLFVVIGRLRVAFLKTRLTETEHQLCKEATSLFSNCGWLSRSSYKDAHESCRTILERDCTTRVAMLFISFRRSFFFQNANQLQVKYSYRSGGNTGPRTFSLEAVLFH
jgi:hypothetical protein